MKKLFLIAAVLIAAAALCAVIVSCEFTAPDFTQPEAQVAAGSIPKTMTFNVVEASDGQVTLEYAAPVVKNSAKALTLPLAKAATNVYEVIFTDGTKIWRRNFKEGDIVKMTIDWGLSFNNTTAVKAYMFAGRDDTLLGIGEISEVVYKDTTPTNSTAPFLINANTYSVTFELEALETDVKNAADSTFKSWNYLNGDSDDPDASDPGEVDEDNPYDHFITGESVKDLILSATKTLPIFMVEKDATTTATIEITTEFADAILLKPVTLTSTYFKHKTFFEVGKSMKLTDLVNLDVASGGITKTASALTITIEIETADADHIAVFEYAIPVILFDDGAAQPGTKNEAKTWYLRGGLANSQYDLGAADDSQGGRIVLGVGNIDALLADLNGEEDEDGFIVIVGDIE